MQPMLDLLLLEFLFNNLIFDTMNLKIIHANSLEVAQYYPPEVVQHNSIEVVQYNSIVEEIQCNILKLNQYISSTGHSVNLSRGQAVLLVGPRRPL